jgi:hypothetical protein
VHLGNSTIINFPVFDEWVLNLAAQADTKFSSKWAAQPADTKFSYWLIKYWKMYNIRITEVHHNVKFLSVRVTFLWPTILVLTQFLREKRLNNAQGRGLCEANAGHAPRAMVIWGRGIVGDAINSWCDRPDDRFWSVSHIRRRYTKPVFTGFFSCSTGIKQLLQICIYMLFRAVTLV